MTKTRRATVLTLAFALVLLASCGKKQDKAESPPPSSGTAPGGTVTPPPAARPDPGQAPVDPTYSDLAFLMGQPLAPENEIAIGNIYLNQGKADSALAHYEQATRLDPKNVGAWNYTGIALVRLNRLAEAKTAYDKAADLDAYDGHTHVNLGNLYFKQEKFDLAAKEYQIATTIDTTNARAWLNLGLAYERQDQLNPAILAYNKAVEADPRDGTGYERLGWIYSDRMFYKEAIDRWRRAVAREPSRQYLLENIAKLEAYLDSTGAR